MDQVEDKERWEVRDKVKEEGWVNRFSSVTLDLNHSNYHGGLTVICTGDLLAPF